MTIETIRVPDLGGAEEVQVIELAVTPGQRVEVDQTLLVLESEKATMELPSPVAGVVVRILVAEGDKIEKTGDALLEIEIAEAQAVVPAVAEPAHTEPEPEPEPERGEVPASVARRPAPEATSVAPPGRQSAELRAAEFRAAEFRAAESESASARATSGGDLYAGPYVRRLARDLGVELAQIQGSGPRQRITKEDVQNFVRRRLSQPAEAARTGIPRVPEVDYARFGPVSGDELSRIGKLTAANMQRNWLNVPHVTQFDAADITELEGFRRAQARTAEARGIKLSPLPFIIKACAAALRDNPVLNRSLTRDGTHYVQREFVHLGMAVDTPRGLLVPVIRDVDQKGIWQLAAEIADLAERARAGKLRIDEMQGACFTVSSLGAIGGEGFTPIVNAPEVAILGVSRSGVKPVWNGTEFVPRTLLPLSLSYDHRVVNGGDGGRFLTQVVELLSDIRALLL